MDKLDTSESSSTSMSVVVNLYFPYAAAAPAEDVCFRLSVCYTCRET